MFSKLAILAGSLALMSCAQVTVSPVPTGVDGPGVRYWEPWPYLLVTQRADKKGEVSPKLSDFEIVYLPNLCKQRTIEMSAGLGVAEMQPTLQDGWMLTALNAKADSQADEIIAAVATLVPSVMALDADPDADFLPGFYPLIFDANGMLTGFGERISINPDEMKMTSMETLTCKAENPG